MKEHLAEWQELKESTIKNRNLGFSFFVNLGFRGRGKTGRCGEMEDTWRERHYAACPCLCLHLVAITLLQMDSSQLVYYLSLICVAKNVL